MSEMRIVGAEEPDLQISCQAHRSTANRPANERFSRDKSGGRQPIR